MCEFEIDRNSLKLVAEALEATLQFKNLRICEFENVKERKKYKVKSQETGG